MPARFRIDCIKRGKSTPFESPPTHQCYNGKSFGQVAMKNFKVDFWNTLVFDLPCFCTHERYMNEILILNYEWINKENDMSVAAKRQ